MKNLAILGSTGSIGTQALEVADSSNDINIVALSANNSVELFAQQIRKFKPDIACLMNEARIGELKTLVADVDVKIVGGMEGLIQIAEYEKSDMLLTSVVGNVGLLPTVAAIKKGQKILLANKETLVTAGELIMPLAKEYNVDILPVDSEHSAIFQCLQGNSYNKIKKILLTASGGPFFGRTAQELENITKADALKHPNWSMGAKITIDSATLMNKGLEIIEAKWLFGVDVNDIEVLVHRQSIVHSAVQFCDNSVIAQLGVPDMKLPISYAINYPERTECITPELDMFSCGPLTFAKPDSDTFRCLALAIEAVRRGGLVPTVMNAANEVAVELFLNDKIGFADIARFVENTMNGIEICDDLTIESIVKYDGLAREYCRALI